MFEPGSFYGGDDVYIGVAIGVSRATLIMEGADANRRACRGNVMII